MSKISASFISAVSHSHFYQSSQLVFERVRREITATSGQLNPGAAIVNHREGAGQALKQTQQVSNIHPNVRSLRKFIF